ncbi:MAG: DUF5050 domain-containing protein [Lachnospiraceae bacterium]|nr:DUF5050 domain-containing protein [Lachnospiraceae bacterium]
MKKRFGVILFLLCCCCISVKTKAASSYELYRTYGTNTKNQVGKYTVQIKTKGMRIKKGNGSYKYIVKGMIGANFLSNGSYIYYTKVEGTKVRLYRVKMNGKSNKKITTLVKKLKTDEAVRLEGLYKNHLYFSYGQEGQFVWYPDYNYYHLKTKKIKRNIVTGLLRLYFYKGKIYGSPVTDCLDSTTPIYQMNLDGTNQKTVVEGCDTYQFIDGMIYYSSFGLFEDEATGERCYQCRLTRCSMNGTNIKVLVIKTRDECDYIDRFDDQYIWYSKDQKLYKEKYNIN